METNKTYAVQEIAPTEALASSRPVIACFSDYSYIVGKNGIAALNYRALEDQAQAAAEPLRDDLMMWDLGFREDANGEVTMTINLDDEEEEDQATVPSMSGHHFFSCPQELAARAQFISVGDRVSGRLINGKAVTGKLVTGSWSYVTISDDSGAQHVYVPVESLTQEG